MGSISRRSFVELAVGSLMSLPVLAGGIIVAPTIARADDNPDATASTGEPEIRNYAIIDVVRPWEVGFIVRDVTRVIRTQTDDEENDRVQGTAHVVVTSRTNGKSASGDTDEDGIVNLDIKELAEDPDGVKPSEDALAVQAESTGLVEESFAIEPGEYRVFQVRTAPDDVQNPNQRHMEKLVVEPADASGTLSPAPTSVTKGAPRAPKPQPTSQQARRALLARRAPGPQRTHARPSTSRLRTIRSCGLQASRTPGCRRHVLPT